MVLSKHDLDKLLTEWSAKDFQVHRRDGQGIGPKVKVRSS